MTILHQVWNSDLQCTPTTPTRLGIIGICRNTVINKALPFKDAKYDYLQLTTGSEKFGPEFHPF
jgi:hypothetical protein